MEGHDGIVITLWLISRLAKHHHLALLLLLLSSKGSSWPDGGCISEQVSSRVPILLLKLLGLLLLDLDVACTKQHNVLLLLGLWHHSLLLVDVLLLSVHLLGHVKLLPWSLARHSIGHLSKTLALGIALLHLLLELLQVLRVDVQRLLLLRFDQHLLVLIALKRLAWLNWLVRYNRLRT